MTDSTMPMATPDTFAPLGATGANRLASLDFTRGIAVMGILAANIVAFGQPYAAYLWPDAFLTRHGLASDLLWVVQFILIDGKMRGLFTLLFGAGMMLFLYKAWDRGSGRWLQARRLFWLMLFGLAHFFLLWRGDVLWIYAVAGFITLGAARWAARTQLMAGILGYVVGSLMLAGMMGPLYAVAETPFGDSPAFAEMRADLEEGKGVSIAQSAEETQVILDGSYGDYVSYVANTHSGDLAFNFMLILFETVPLVLIGMALYRMGLFSGGFSSAVLRKWGWIGLAAGTVMTAALGIWAYSTGLTYYATISAAMGLAQLPRLPVIISLAALLALWGPLATGWLGQRVTAAGRATFTNYIGTSFVMLLVFHGWAGGLYGTLNRPQLYLVVMLAWVIMLAWSKPWLARFRFGPLEWLWRCLTYGRIFRLRR